MFVVAVVIIVPVLVVVVAFILHMTSIERTSERAYERRTELERVKAKTVRRLK